MSDDEEQKPSPAIIYRTTLTVREPMEEDPGIEPAPIPLDQARKFMAALHRPRDWIRLTMAADWIVRLGLNVPAKRAIAGEYDLYRAEVFNALWIACFDGLIQVRGWIVEDSDTESNQAKYNDFIDRIESASEGFGTSDPVLFAPENHEIGRHEMLGPEWFQGGKDPLFSWGLTSHMSLKAFAFLLEVRWPDVCKVFPQATLGEQPALPEPVEPARRGPRGKYDWEELLREVARRANTPDGLPETQAALIREMSDWCSATWGSETVPSEPMMKAKLAGIIPTR